MVGVDAKGQGGSHRSENWAPAEGVTAFQRTAKIRKILERTHPHRAKTRAGILGCLGPVSRRKWLKNKQIRKLIDRFLFFSKPKTRYLISQRFPQISRPPRNHCHACRHHPRPRDRSRPGDGSARSPRVPLRAGGPEVGGPEVGGGWECCHPQVHHGTRWSMSTTRGHPENRWKPNLPIKSKRQPAL